MPENYIIINLCMLIPLILIIVLVVIKNMYNNNMSKNSPFECGYNPYKKARMPFSMRFFLITIIFLIFDTEITLLFPLTLMMPLNQNIYMPLMILTIMLLLFMALLHEINIGVLNWMK